MSNLVNKSDHVYNTQVTLRMKKILEESLQHYCIDKSFFKAFKEHLNKASDDQLSRNDTLILTESLYGINFSNILDNSDNPPTNSRIRIVESLIKYALNFITIYENKNDTLSLNFEITT
jgi:hypothetical protein